MNVSLSSRLLSCMVAVLLPTLPLIATNAHGETLDDVMSSKAMEAVMKQTERSKGKRAAKNGFDGQSPYTAGMDPRANFTQLWLTSKGPNLLFSWIGANLPRYKLQIIDSSRTFEDLSVYARIVSPDRRRVTLEIRLPHPNYYVMASHKTLAQFNKFEPPVLKVVAQEEVEFHGIPAVYYRTEAAQCSLLFKTERMGIVNLSVERCDNSAMMMDVAESLDFKRLNAKLTS